MREEKFSVAGSPKVAFRLPLGEAKVVDGAPGEVTVLLDGRDATVERFVVELRGDEVVIEPDRGSAIRWSPITLTVRIGEPADIRARLTSADLTVEATVASLQAESASGDLTAGDVIGQATIHSASGDIRLRRVNGWLDAATASGDIRVESVAAGASLKSASGGVHLGTSSGDVTVKSASGDVMVSRFDGSSLDVKSVSGDVTVGVVPGRRLEVAFQTVSGGIRNEFPVSAGRDGLTGRLALKTISGGIVVRGAAT